MPLRLRLLSLSGGHVSIRRTIVAFAGVLLAFTLPATAQRAAIQPDSAQAQIRTVLRAFYLNLESRNWEALAAYVLSPKLLERRGAPGDLEAAARDRARGRGSSHAAAETVTCTSSTSPLAEQATILLDGDWAEVSVPRCSGTSAGADEFRLLYFEERWRFIYTDLFEAPTNVSTESQPRQAGQ
jgi:hypothetical protein